MKFYKKIEEQSQEYEKNFRKFLRKFLKTENLWKFYKNEKLAKN